MRRLAHRSGTALIALGVLVCLYAAVVVLWRDPFTDVYTAYQQRGLRGGLAAADRRWERVAQAELPRRAPATASTGGARRIADAVVVRRTVRRLAAAFAADYARRQGTAIGRLHIPRLGLGTILVQGTDYWASLAKGPGHYERTTFPGLGRTVGIAGHRTTFSAPFRHIDDLRTGDEIELRMPYGDFRYRVTSHRVVDNGDWSIIREVGHEQVVLSACHPLYSAAQRWVVFARLVSVTLPGAARAVPA